MSHKTITMAVTLAVLGGDASAACTSSDSWTGSDKAAHLAVGAAIGSGGTLILKDANRAFLLALGIGAVKEAIDSQSSSRECSLQDFIAAALGAAAGAYGTAWIISPTFIGYAKRF